MSTHPESTGPGPAYTQEVADGVYAYIQPDGTWMINNAGFVTGRTGVSVVDASSTERRTRDFLAAIAARSPAPVRTLINTHSHPDHTAGNGLFTGATIVGHDNARPEMLAMGLPENGPIFSPVDYGDLTLAPPFLTFADHLTLWSDELECRVLYCGGPAHTTSDVVVWIPERSVLFAGDLLFNGGTPFLLSGSVYGAIEVLEGFVKPLGAQTIVPGHGPVTGPDVIDDVLAYLHFVVALAEDGVAAGVTPLELARGADLGEFAELSDPERLVGNLHRAYADLSGPPEQRGRPIDAPGALADMVAYNGGQPLTCRA